MRSLESLWKQYTQYKVFNYSSLNDTLKRAATKVEFLPKSIITMAGDYPRFVYFITEGVAQGVRIYQNGNSYHYFVLNEEDGSIGMLELLSQETCYVATLVAMTKVTAYRVESALVYETIMTDIALLRSCLYIVSHDLYKRSGNDGLLYYRNGLDRVQFFLTNYYITHAQGLESVVVSGDYQSIANCIGASLRTVGRSIQLLKEEALVTLYKKKITVSYEQYERMCERI